MKKTIITLVLAATLAGCANNPLNDPRVQQLTDGIRLACSYEIQFGSALALIAKFAGGESILTIVNQACAAVTTKSARRGAGGPVLRGVRIRGEFVR